MLSWFHLFVSCCWIINGQMQIKMGFEYQTGVVFDDSRVWPEGKPRPHRKQILKEYGGVSFQVDDHLEGEHALEIVIPESTELGFEVTKSTSGFLLAVLERTEFVLRNGIWRKGDKKLSNFLSIHIFMESSNGE